MIFSRLSTDHEETARVSRHVASTEPSVHYFVMIVSELDTTEMAGAGHEGST